MLSTTNKNNFKLGIYLADQEQLDTIIERVFSADLYSPQVRNTIDIKNYYPTILKGINQLFNKQSFNHKLNEYDLLGKYEDLLSQYGIDYSNSKLSRPNVHEIFIDDRANVGQKITISGVPIKIGLYLNDNPIIERIIYIRKYNPNVRFSTELYDFVADTVNDICEDIKTKDIAYQLNEQNNFYTKPTNTTPIQIGEFTKEKRTELLNRI
jgi:hypothetical protein